MVPLKSALSRLGKKRVSKCYMQAKSSRVALVSMETKLSSVTTLRKHVRLLHAQYTQQWRWLGQKWTMSGIGCSVKMAMEMKIFLLRPTSYSRIGHEETIRIVCGWKRWMQRRIYGRSPNGFGWKILDNDLQHVLMTKEQAQLGLPELTVYHCKKSSCRRPGCACGTNSMPCAEVCACLARENSRNPSSIRQFTDDEDNAWRFINVKTRCIMFNYDEHIPVLPYHNHQRGTVVVFLPQSYFPCVYVSLSTRWRKKSKNEFVL